MTLAPGTSVGPYDIVGELGRGGMGEVYRATDSRLKRDVAVKVLPAAAGHDVNALARFQREAEAVAALSHPNIMAVYDVGREGGISFLVCELLQGETLRSRLERAPIPWRQAVEFAVAIADGLAAAHAKGIIHRDLKPANLFLTEDGLVKILDFGLARMADAVVASDETVTLDTKPGTILGTTPYMSPEQVRGEVVDERTDVFAFGCVLYEMLTGRRVFNGSSPADVATAVLTLDPPPVLESVPGIPPELDRVITRCLNKRPRARFQSVDDLAFTLRSVLTHGDASRHAERVTDSSSSAIAFQSIAVLPFENMSGDPGNEYFSDGIAEEIINTLARLPGLRVAARTSAFSFKGQAVDIADVGRRLNVTTVLEGSVRKAGDRIRITTQLINAEDGHHVWSDRFDRQLHDVFAVQDEIAGAIADKLKLTLGVRAGSEGAKAPTDNMEAYELFLKGRQQVGRGYGMDLLTALAYFERAVTLDAEFAAAHAAIAETYGSLGFMSTLPPREAMPKARASAERALELDECVAEAHCALGCVHMTYDRDWPAAERHFLRSLELNPNFVQALYHYGHPFHAYVTGTYDEGIELCRRAVELDPLAAYPLHGWLANLFGAGRTSEAIPHLQAGLSRDPGAFHLRRILALCLFEESQLKMALETSQTAVRDSGRHPWALYELGAISAALGRKREAEKIDCELKNRARVFYVQPMVLAFLAAWRGLFDEAFACLDRAVEERDSILIALTTWPMCKPLRADPRYDVLLARLGLPYRR
jgi:serine/threonine-protein kinase